ncbi:MAG: hypothetical protein ACLQIB_41940 [Isosphaeraceae bacterium]
MTKPISTNDFRARAALPQPDMPLSERIASRLRELGFRVAETTARGVTFTGPSELFKRAFDVRVEETDRGPTLTQSPRLPEPFDSAHVRLYLPTAPEFHA